MGMFGYGKAAFSVRDADLRESNALRDRWVREGNSPFGQKVLIEKPPVWDAVAAQFPVVGKAVVFSYGNKVYNPQGIRVPYEILAHEAQHGDRQEIYGVERWWKEYLHDKLFRLEEEFDAHMVEYAHLKSWAVNRKERRGFEALVSEKLASPLYGFGLKRLTLREVMRRGTLDALMELDR